METGKITYKPLKKYTVDTIGPGGQGPGRSRYWFAGQAPHMGLELEFCSGFQYDPLAPKVYTSDQYHGYNSVDLKNSLQILHAFGREAGSITHFSYDYKKRSTQKRYYSAFEFRTVPLGLDEHNKRWINFLNSPWMRNGFTRPMAYGIHIHCDKKFFASNEAIARVMYLLGNSSRFFELFGRRRPQWSAFKHFESFEAAKVAIDRGEIFGKSYALNPRQMGTLEFRFFPPTFEWTKVLAFLELVDALAHFGNNCALGCTIPGFLAFAAEQPQRYTNMLRRANLVMKVLNKRK